MFFNHSKALNKFSFQVSLRRFYEDSISQWIIFSSAPEFVEGSSLKYIASMKNLLVFFIFNRFPIEITREAFPNRLYVKRSRHKNKRSKETISPFHRRARKKIHSSSNMCLYSMPDVPFTFLPPEKKTEMKSFVEVIKERKLQVRGGRKMMM